MGELSPNDILVHSPILGDPGQDIVGDFSIHFGGHDVVLRRRVWSVKDEMSRRQLRLPDDANCLELGRTV